LQKLVHEFSPDALPALSFGDLNTPNVPAVKFLPIGQPVETGGADQLLAGERTQDKVAGRCAGMQVGNGLLDGRSSVLLGRLAKGARFPFQGFEAECPEDRGIG
jgi:hypothetical protein